ncbi:hypothetical protein QSU92_08655 [Microbacterium sp. ET2]|uniref:hypothetical protein n=1 Tax=Microbacterium albipurpureum TaxID=3050384 RepID=UPI00259CB01A|nr:hypothetical protein [Microbacterium sp. ET2 (Ac-2212)]WJL97211.1 hypothetical protein QSU92_08655 [Microbacterium sp. ET2 (Ac-2212)]
MRRFVVRFWSAFATAAVIVGLYLGAAALSLELVFWLIVAGCLVVAVLWTAVPWILKALPKIRGYDALLKRTGTLQGEMEDLRANAMQFASVRDELWREGYDDGIRAAQGAVLGSTADTPSLLAVALTDDGIAFVGEGQHLPTVGSWFSVVTNSTTEVKGVVEVIESDPASRKVVLLCVEKRNEEYWDRLEARAVIDETVPPGTVLAKFSIGQQRVRRVVRRGEEGIQ